MGVMVDAVLCYGGIDKLAAVAVKIWCEKEIKYVYIPHYIHISVTKASRLWSPE
jgi:hypothetical protein